MTEFVGPPTLALPFPSGRYAEEHHVRARARAVRERLDAAGLGRFVQDDAIMADLICRTSPQADIGSIGYVADWLLWVFPLDDLCEEVFSETKFAEGIPTDTAFDMNSVPVSTLPQVVTTGVADFHREVTAHMSSEWSDLFSSHLNTYILHAIHFAGLSDTENLPELNDFLILRREEGAAKPTIDLIEVATRADLPDEVHDSALWRQICDTCADVLTWSNDIFSYRKERRSGTRFNLIDVLVHHGRLTEQQALVRAVDMTNARAQDFTDRATELLCHSDFLSLAAETRAAARRCLEGMKHWMRGQYDWFVITRPDRYQVQVGQEAR
ncbi:terpene synthase family protein [Amycolatopsis sp. lyj-90]|uniref:terpene synthase family protein n=1 Tax=Amycolatopsis sp. lyj-90 TaxID=2789285 RepID=UPI00397D0AB8